MRSLIVSSGMVKQEASLWRSLSKDHIEILVRIQLLENALIDLLNKRVKNIDVGRASKFQEDFLELFKIGVMEHFKTEEEILFPMLREKAGKEAEKIVSELLVEHETIMQRYFKIVKNKGSLTDQSELLLALLKHLSEHAKKEELIIPTLLKT